jgi:mannose-6-phosphate isomerase-like protein (cupin superfamily)
VHITKRAALDHALLPSAEERTYYKYDFLECIVTRVPARHRQDMHSHRHIREIYIVMEGSLAFYEGTEMVVAERGDTVIFDPSETPHTVENTGDEAATTVTIKVPYLADMSALFRSDKVVPRTTA